MEFGNHSCILPIFFAWILSSTIYYYPLPFFWLGRIHSVQFSHSDMSNPLWPHGLQHTRLPCPSPTPGACSNLSPLSRWWHPTISSSVISFSSCLKSFPAPGSSPRSQFFTSGGQSIAASASASILPMNIQGWFLLGLTGLTSLLSQGLSRVFSTLQLKSINFVALNLFYGPTLTSICNYWKNQSFNYMDLYQQSNVSVF